MAATVRMAGSAHIREVTDPRDRPSRGPPRRRTVPAVGQLLTVVFVELESSTELLTSVDDPGSAAIDRALRVVRDRVEPYDGHIAKGLGDGLMLTFPSPRSAVAFAVAVQQASPGPPRLRIGMNFGELADGDPVGETVSAAARITDKAAGGEVLVSDVVCRLAGSMPGVRFVDRGRLKLKGFPTRWQLHGVVPAAGVEVPAPVFGRDAELEHIDELIASVVQGSGQAMLLEGEAGIGKTHLIRAAAARARASGTCVVVGGADELEQDRPGRILAAVADGLGVPFDEWALPRGDEHGTDPAYAVVERFVDTVQDAAVRRPVVVLVEDLHWADELSLRGIASLLRRSGPLAIGVVATMRPTPRTPSLLRTLDAAGRAGVPTLHLDGLDASAVAGLVASLTAAAPGAGLRRRLDATGGNPLYVTELVRALDEEGALHVVEGLADTNAESLPGGLVQTLDRRITALASETAEILRLASLLGGEFSLDDLAAVAGLSVVDVAALLHEAVDAGLVTGAGQRLAFRHDLIREAVYLGVAPAVRTDLHLAAAQALAGAGASAAQVARQYALGARPGDAVGAGWVLQAAREAMLLDTSTAVSLLEQALALAPPDWSERTQVEAALVELLAWSGRVDDGRALARSVLDRSLTPADELRARRALGTVLSTVGELTGAAEQMAAAADLPDVGDVERGILRCAAAGMSLIAGHARPEDAQLVGAAHVDTEAPELACWARNTLAVAAVCAGDYEAELEHARIACNLLEANYVPPLGFLIPQTWLPTAYYNLDRFEEAADAARIAYRLGERRGDVGIVVHANSMLAGLAWVTGDWDEATSVVDVALALVEETGISAQTVFQRAIGALVAVGRGDHGLAEEHLGAAQALYDSGLQHPFGLDCMFVARAQLLEFDGRPDAASALLGAVWDQVAGIRGLVQWRALGADLARTARAAGDVDRADAVARDVEEIAGRSPSTSARVAAERTRALASGDVALLCQAVDRSRLVPRVVDTAAMCEEAAALLVRAGRGDEAVALLDEAAALHEGMGATGHLARIDSLLRAVGARRRRSSPAPATHGWPSLSPKEQDVVELVAAGLSNPEVADRLYISRRTVETHLSHVFRKLGLSNRTQLAAAAVERSTR